MAEPEIVPRPAVADETPFNGMRACLIPEERVRVRTAWINGSGLIDQLHGVQRRGILPVCRDQVLVQTDLPDARPEAAKREIGRSSHKNNARVDRVRAVERPDVRSLPRTGLHDNAVVNPRPWLWGVRGSDANRTVTTPRRADAVVAVERAVELDHIGRPGHEAIALLDHAELVAEKGADVRPWAVETRCAGDVDMRSDAVCVVGAVNFNHAGVVDL